MFADSIKTERLDCTSEETSVFMTFYKCYCCQNMLSIKLKVEFIINIIRELMTGTVEKHLQVLKIPQILKIFYFE